MAAVFIERAVRACDISKTLYGDGYTALDAALDWAVKCGQDPHAIAHELLETARRETAKAL